MKLPNGEQAVVDIAKLRDYCLSSKHLRGRHKARIFMSVLAMNEENAEELRFVLLQAAKENEAVISTSDLFGVRYIMDVTVKRASRKADLRSIWIVRADEDFPRFVTCYILTDRGGNVTD